jgi:hypothetical protein
MARISVEALEALAKGLDYEITFIDGVAAGLGVAQEAVEYALAEAYAQEACDCRTEPMFEDAMYEVAVLDEDGDDASLIGFFFDRDEAVDVAKEEAYESGSLVMFRILNDENDVVFCRIFGGEF